MTNFQRCDSLLLFVEIKTKYLQILMFKHRIHSQYSDLID